MNDQDRFEADLRNWLSGQAPRSAPEGLVATGMSEVRATPQRRTLAWFVAAPLTARVLAAGVVVAGVIAAALLLDVLPANAPPGASSTPGPSPTPCSTAARGYSGTVAAAFPTTVGAVRGMTAIGDNPQLASFADGERAWLCYIDGQIAKGPPPPPDPSATVPPSFNRAIVVVVGDQSYLIAAGYAQSLPIEDPPPTPSPSPSASEPPGQPAFTTNAPTSATVTWSSITWSRIAENDVKTRVARVVRWSGGYIALGQEVRDTDVNVRTPVWTSTDGVTWEPLAPSVLGVSTVIVDVVEVPDGLVAITATSPTCWSGPCASVRGTLASWTSTDGRTWTSHPGPALIADGADARPPVVAGGPAGIIVASGRFLSQAGGSQMETQAAVSRDGVAWTEIPSSAFPDGFVIGGLWGRADGYAAVGTVGPDIATPTGLALWSPDGMTWSAAEGALVAAAGGNRLAVTGPPGWVASSLVPAADGAIAIGGVAGAPGATLWWQSSDGRHWSKLESYPPMGAWPGPGEGMGGMPDGWLVGDGTRLAALRLRADPAAWVSFDGAGWSFVAMRGDIPVNQTNAGVLTLLPGGLIYTDGSGNWWYGAAAVP